MTKRTDLPDAYAEYQEAQEEGTDQERFAVDPPSDGWTHGATKEPEPLEGISMSFDTIAEGPANAEPIPEAPPKRGRGRPPKDPSAPPKPRRATRRTRSMETQIGGTLALINMAFLFVPEPWRNDALSDTEITALAKSLDAAASQNPRMKRYLSAVMVEGGAMADLVIVVGIIAGSRLSRHGLIDPAFDATLQSFLDRKMGDAETSPVP